MTNQNPEPERVIPSPGEIAKTIIDEFYRNRVSQEKEWKESYQIESGTTFGLQYTAYVHQQRLEEILKRIWALLLEAKAERGALKND